MIFENWRKLYIFILVGIAFIMISILLLSLVEAQRDQCKVNENYKFSIPCFACEGCGEYCSPTSECNITIESPYGDILINNEKMTNQIAFHNYTLNSSFTNESGKYTRTIACIDGSKNGSYIDSFICNVPGIQSTNTRSDSITRAVYLFFLLGILLIVGGFFTRRKFYPIKWSLWILGSISIIVSINLISVSLRDEFVNPAVVSLFNTLTAITFYLIWFAAVIVFLMWILSILFSIKNMVSQKKIERFG